MHSLILTIIVAVTSQAAAEPTESTSQNWPQWRGPLGTGVAPLGDPPVEWSEEKNVQWKVAIPGRGHATPIVWGENIFLTAAVPIGPKLEPRKSGRPGAHDNLSVSQRHRFVALAVDRMTGKVLWQKTLNEALPVEGAHYSASLASASPVADGDHVFAFFGSHGLFCLDHAGNVVWQKDLGQLHTKHGHGEGASPALYGSTLVINWDHEEESFIVALNKSTGKELWRKSRKEVTSWATPIIVEHEGKQQVIVCGTSRVRGYDLASGNVLWECGGLSANIVATPVYSDGIVIAGSSYEKKAMLAIRLAGSTGDITDSEQVIWSRRRGTPYVPSPLLYDGALYFHAHYQSVLTRLNAKTGEETPGPFRLPGIGNVYASAVGAAGRVYVTDLEGTTLVFSNEDKPRILARNVLDDRFNASAAIVGKQLLLRGEKFLYCVGP
ncbi:MAG: outer membrane protein assembly factor BamB family protein [Planctomycetales bacterium]|jgi:outer membrane protein assembly factor BamB